MHAHTKARAWAKEFVEVFRGPVIMEIYKEPPEHYLGYVLDTKVPIILIPGVMNTWGTLRKLGDKISLVGHPVHIVRELGKNTDTVPRSAKILRRIVLAVIPKHKREIQRRAKGVKEYLEKKDIKGAVLVAYSKGGLIGKYFLAHQNSDGRVLGMVSIATPYSGSGAAKLMPQKAFRELELDSKIIKDLRGHTEVNKKIISIYPSYDTHVWSPDKSRLDGAAENREIPIAGHSIINNVQIQEAVLAAIEKITNWKK